MRLDTPALFSTQSMVMGSVAEEELVEKAVMSAGAIALKWRNGLTLPINFNMRGSAINMKAPNPKRTERVNIPSEPSDLTPVSEKARATKKKTPIGRNFITRWIKRIIVWKMA